MKKSITKAVTKKIVSVAIAAALILSVVSSGAMTTSAAESTGVGLSAHALQAYNEHWSYVWGGTSYGSVDCSGLFVTYNGVGGVRTDLLGSSSEWGYVSNGIPRIHGLGLHQPGHVGIYIGNDTAIDARNEYYGVVYHDATNYSWVEWFKVAGVSYPTTGWVRFNGESFYYENGQYIINTSRTFDGVTYYFGSDGASNIAPPSGAYSATDYSGSDTIGEPEAPNEASKPESSKPEESSKVEESSEPEESSKVEESSEPEESSKVEESSEPEESSKVEESSEPEESSKVEESSEPEESSKVEESSEPEESSKVEESSEPEESSKVEESSEPEESSKVEESSEPEESSKVEESSEPEESSKPEESSEPEEPKFEVIKAGTFDDGDNTRVADIQNTLTTLGYFTDTVSGYYGEATESAVNDFQNKVGLKATGEVDEDTWNAIFDESAPAKYNEYKSGDFDEEQSDIADIQSKLAELSYLTDGEYAEGSFDGNTVIAVKRFQAANNLEITGDASLSTQIVLFGGYAAANPDPDEVIYGMSGSAVTKLQKRLYALRYTTAEPTGVFDDATLEAVNAYQKNVGLKISDSMSSEALKVFYSDKAVKSSDYNNLQLGYSGNDVKALEDKLTKLGYYGGSISGEFDSELQDALEKYQDENELSVTGVADDSVIDSIGKSVARRDSENSQGIIISTATVADKAMSGIANNKTEKLSLEKTQSENDLTNARNTLFIFLGLILVLSATVITAMVRSKRRMTAAMKAAAVERRNPRYTDRKF